MGLLFCSVEVVFSEALTHRVFSNREEEISFPVVFDLSDGPLMALEQDGSLWTVAKV